MSAIISAIIFFLFAGAVANPFSRPPGEKFIPGIGEGSPRTCIPADASQGTPVLFGIPKPGKENVPFVDQPNRFFSCSGKGEGCDVSPWDGKPIPPVADYVTVAQNVVLTHVWPDNDTTRLAKQILPQEGEPNYRSDFDEGDFRDRIYRPTCNDWCYFVPPRRSPALPYGGTFFCDFIFFYQGQSAGAGIHERKYSPKDGSSYPDDTSCDPDTLENCPVFDVLIRKGAAVPEVAGGAAPGSETTPLRCDLINATPTPKSDMGPISPIGRIGPILSRLWPETATAQTESFINLIGNHDARGEWIYNTEKITYAGKMLDPAGGREKIPEPPPIIFRGKEYEAYFNLIKSLVLNKKILYLVETGLVEQADEERAANNPDFEFSYLEFRRSTDKTIPEGKSLQLGTFPVATARGWWELFPEESKPAIYLYPEEPVALNVKLETKGRLTVSDPPYDPSAGWNVISYPDGSLIPINTPNTPNIPNYPYLYYEAILDRVRVEPTGFLVPGSKLSTWFSSILPKLGLNSRETADFIEYWMSRLNPDQPYYFIHFLSEEQIENLEPLKITQLPPDSPNNPNIPNSPTPRTSNLEPRTSIRIRPYFKPLSADEASQLKITPQSLPSSPPPRRGFTLVEWGGILVE